MKTILRFCKSRLAAVLLVISLVTACFVPIIEHEFVAYDDYVYITQNPIVTGKSLTTNFYLSFSHTYEQNYSPLLWISYTLIYNTFGTDPFYYHLVSLLAHLTGSIFLFGIAKKLNINRAVALIAVILWATHPQRVEAVAWAASGC